MTARAAMAKASIWAAGAAPAAALPQRRSEAGFVPPIASLSAVPAQPSVQRKCGGCEAGEKEELPVQPRLEVGPAGDRYEREADTIAAGVMAMREAEAGGAPPAVRRACSACSAGEEARPRRLETEKDEEESPSQVRARREHGRESIAASHGALTSGGAALPAATRDFFERRMRRDLSGVRVHQGPSAAALNRSIAARAFTYRDHIWLGGGERAGPSFTMAHELAHVMQQTAPGPVGPGVAARREASPASGKAQRAPPQPATPPPPPTGGSPAAGAGCALELCFAPIGVAGLGKAGLVHAKLNYTNAAGTQRAHVEPSQHGSTADPASGSVGGRGAGIHSHVETGAGAGSGTTCIPIAATCAQIAAVKASVAKYEALDVVYNAPPGPNSNSFAEWVLNDAGIPTTGISTPAGALGWSYYINNPGDRSKPPRVARTASDTKCPSGSSKASSFRALVDLIRKAETQLTSSCGVADVGERLNILRGIFYGSPWSRDYDTSQKSHVRNQMFNVYSGTAQPRYALECMDCSTFLSLGKSQDVVDAGRRLDVGHMLIGMDARRSFLARTMTQPIGGVTGLEATTWAGDLGGGAARLSVDRIAAPTASPLTYFKGTDYGGPINLEGDVAGYAVGPTTASAGSAPSLTIPAGQGVADAVESYLLGTGGATPGRDSRCTRFLTAMGGTFNASGGLANKPAVQSYVAGQIESFGCWYMVNFMRQHGGINLTRAEEAAHHIAGVSREMSELFVKALEACHATPAKELEVKGPAPAPTPKASSPSCTAALLAAKASVKAGSLLDEGKKSLDQLQKDVGKEIEQRRRAAQKWWDEL